MMHRAKDAALLPPLTSRQICVSGSRTGPSASYLSPTSIGGNEMKREEEEEGYQVIQDRLGKEAKQRT